MNSRLLVAVLDESVDLTGEKIDAGQQADRAVTLLTRGHAPRSHIGRAWTAGPGPSLRSPGCRASRHRRRSPTASLGSVFDWAALSFRIFTSR